MTPTLRNLLRHRLYTHHRPYTPNLRLLSTKAGSKRGATTGHARMISKSVRRQHDQLGRMSVRSDCGRFKYQTGKLAPLARSSVVGSDTDTVVLATVACETLVGQDAGEAESDMETVPLTVDYREFGSAAGQIPFTFSRREHRQRDGELITSRLIDRAVRPFFPKEFYRNKQLQITCSTLAFDGVGDVQLLAINSALMALSLCDRYQVPWSGPLAAVRVGMLPSRRIVVNPLFESNQVQDLLGIVNEAGKPLYMLDLLVVGSKAGIVTFESRSNTDEITSADVKHALTVGHSALLEFLGLQRTFRFQYKNRTYSPDSAFELQVQHGKKDKEIVREDGRGRREMRAFEGAVSSLPIVHGSSSFNLGDTSTICLTTLGSRKTSLKVHPYVGQAYEKTFFVHHNVPPYAKNHVGKFGSNRYTLEQGLFVESAINPVIPPSLEFPCTIRVSSDVLTADGGATCASVCAASLSLLDAGVQLKKPVAAVSVGFRDGHVILDPTNREIKEGQVELKVAGTEEGITVAQLDSKLLVPRTPLFEAIDLSHSAKKIVLKQLEQVIKEPTIKEDRPSCSVICVENTDLGSLIGRGGENIRAIESDTNTKITLVDDKYIEIFSETRTGLLDAIERVRSSAQKARVGEVVTEAKVAKVTPYGARVDLQNGKSGWLHVSEMDNSYVKDVSAFVKEGDTVAVEVIKVADNGDIRLSMKSLKKGRNGAGSTPRVRRNGGGGAGGRLKGMEEGRAS